MSHILSAVDSEGTHYLLLDCTGVEKFELDAYFGFNTFNPIKVNPLKKIVSTLSQEELNKLPSGNLKRNLSNLMGLNELDDIVALDYSYDNSLPTSDYKYPVVSFIPEGMDEDSDDNLVHMVINNVADFDAFMNLSLPSYINHAVIKLGKSNSLKLYLGKTPYDSYYLYSVDTFGIQSSDLSYTIS